MFQCVNSLSFLPEPFLTELPSVTTGSLTQPTTQPTIPTFLLTELPKMWRIVEQVFFLPWVSYMDVFQRNNTNLALKNSMMSFLN